MSRLPTVYITDHTFVSTEPQRAVLGGMARLVDVNGRPMRSEDDVIAACPGAAALIVAFAPIGARVLDALPGLRCVVRYGVGYDNVDVAAAAQRGVWVANVPDYCVAEVADHTLALLLALARKILRLDASVRRSEWQPVAAARPLHRLAGRTLGIIGLGRIGSAVARRARAFGCRVLAYDKYLTAEAVRAAGAEPVDLDSLLGACDALSIHAPLTEETRHMLDARAMARMRREAVIVNTARGAIVDTAALAEALTEGRLAGAGLDVFESEPLPADHPLRSAPNVILQPHAAWYSEESVLELQRSAAEEVARVLRGEPMRNPVNRPRAGTRG